MNIKLLRQKRHEAQVKANEIAAQIGDTLATAEQNTAFDAAITERNGYDAQISRAEQLMETERNAPDAGAIVGKDLSENKPWKSEAEFLLAVRNAAVNPRHADARIMAAQGENESVAAEGGILVPTEYSSTILQRTYDQSVLADRCMDMPMNSASLKLLAVDEKSRVNGSRFGGIQAYWIGEADLYTPSKPKFRPLTLTAEKLIALIYMTEELQADQSFLQAYNSEVVPEEFAFRLDDAIYRGTGAGMPLGFLNSPATIVVSKDAGQAPGTVTTQNILNMLTRLYARSLSNAAFFVNSALVWSQLTSLTIGTGTAVRLIYNPPTTAGGFGTIFGVPVIPIEQAAAAGTQGDIVLADLKSYILAKRQGIRADSSIHVAFLTGETAFRWMMRVDGQPMWNAPLTPANGSITTSPYVVLQTRP